MMATRGIEHIGITVSNIEQAENFFIKALDASILYRIVPWQKSEQRIGGDQMRPVNGFPPQLSVVGLSMLRLGNGCNVELFQLEPGIADDLANIGQPGVNHFSIYVDDINETAEKLKAHGARFYDGPNDCFAQEEGSGNQTWFCLTPFGVLIELITLPSPLQYDGEATQPRWLPAE
ncbi:MULTISPECIES: VOC family protein [Pantoea]|jgi:catechol 2,3-dioxygenase-like lactoylglutathione lyase family enzyme|uniref:VOC family protein n=1 Tax=Pantoea TaxID=53335 RepID=UPI001D82D8A7|nr:MULTISPECIES: VOC family protein [Pantoea]MBZ6386243.1 VOC family protein [Pantoea piersonii]MBZ6401412.1 VOC family protein [Pantoea piersonii]MBZ6409782.1 VOC family protein [Pantoea piersonii]MBZ6428074.1 VOC family protein [Pantoea piersonii]